MDQIVKLVQEKTGIAEDQARMAVQTVVDFLKTKLPEPLAGQIDSLLGGGSGGGLMDQAQGMLGGMGGMFGGKKE